MAARFASVQGWGTRLSLLAMTAAFLLYESGALPVQMTLAEAIQRMGLSADAFVSATGAGAGWSRLARVAQGDVLAMAALLAPMASIAAAYIALVPLLVRQRDRMYLALVLLQLAVFALAASGWLGALGH
jgi:hypothetical protein